MCALALEPASISRNRWFSLYQTRDARHAHGRAVALRKIALQLGLILRAGSPLLEAIPEPSGSLRVIYHEEELSLRRLIHLEPMEASLLRILLAQDGIEAGGHLELREGDCDVVLRVLERLMSLPINAKDSDFAALHAALRGLDEHVRFLQDCSARGAGSNRVRRRGRRRVS